MAASAARTFDYTVDLERSLLRILSTGILSMRQYGNLVRRYMMTSNERKFILSTFQETLKTTGQLATLAIFQYEVAKRVAPADQQYFLGEWNIIAASDTQESPEAILEKLEEAHVGRELLKLGENIDSMLGSGDIRGALASLKRKSMTIGNGMATDRPISEIRITAAREQTIADKKAHPEKYRGLQTGFPFFDKLTGGLFNGELTLIAGVTGTGKSTLCRQLAVNIVTLNPGKNVLHIANEEYLEQVEHKYDANITRIPYLLFKRGEINDNDVERWKRTMANWKGGGIFVKEVPAFTDVTLVEQAYRELEAKGIAIHAIIIDHLPHVKPIQQAWGENDERAKAAADCKEVARWLRLPVVTPTQAATVLEAKQAKGQRGSKMDVYGSKAQVHVANTFILITEKGKDDTQTDREDWQRDVFWTTDVKKNRDGPPFHFTAKHHVQYGLVEEVDGDSGMGKSATLAAIDDDDDGGASPTKKDAQVASAIDELLEFDGLPETDSVSDSKAIAQGLGGGKSIDEQVEDWIQVQEKTGRTALWISKDNRFVEVPLRSPDAIAEIKGNILNPPKETDDFENSSA